MHADILFVNGKIFNTPHKRFFDGFMAVRNGKVAMTGTGEPPETLEAHTVVDLVGKYVVPGLIDIHTHIESVMLTPRALSGELAKRGVTTIVSEPHEIANVAGMRGVLEMIEAARGCDIDIFYGVPSSVPSTSEALETTGGTIGVDEVRALAGNPDMKCLGEVMNARSIVDEPDGLPRRIVAAFRQAAPEKPVEGHCPRLVGEQLAEFVYTGIDSDHTEHSLDEFKERYFFGVLVQIQDKTMSPEIAEYLNQNPGLFERTALVTDDVMADELIEEGHLDYILRRAIDCGFSPEHAVYCATKVPADRMRLFDRGELSPGRIADFAVVDDFGTFKVSDVYKDGRRVADKPSICGKDADGQDGGNLNAINDLCRGFSDETMNSVHVKHVEPSDFAVKSAKSADVLAIEPNSSSTQTKKRVFTLGSDGQNLLWENTETLMIAVFERYGKNGNIGRGFLCGAAHKRGAVATTYCHDHHNLMVAGANADDMALAANTVAESGGGMCVVLDGRVLAHAGLPVGGIMSDEPAEATARKIAGVTAAMIALGYDHYDPIMSFCTLSLPVSPELKITDMGLVDTATGSVADLFM